MAKKYKTLSAATVNALDTAVNEFLGPVTVDNGTITRTILNMQFLISGGLFYLSFFYEEERVQRA